MKPHLPLIILCCLSLQLSAQIKNTYSFAQGDTTQVTISWDVWAETGDPIMGCNIFRLENPDVPLNETLITSVDSAYQFVDDTSFDPYFPPKYSIMAVRSSDTLEVAYAHGFSSIEFYTLGTDSLVMEFVVWNTDTCCLGVYIYLDGIISGLMQYNDPFIITSPYWNPSYVYYDYEIKLQFFSDHWPYADLRITEDFWAYLLTTVGVPETPQPIHQLNVYPNPFTESATISFYLPEASHTQLEVFDLSGRKMLTVVDAYLPAGSHEYSTGKEQLAPGIYFYRVKTLTGSVAGKMMVK
jgi:hypothetical protein